MLLAITLPGESEIPTPRDKAWAPGFAHSGHTAAGAGLASWEPAPQLVMLGTGKLVKEEQRQFCREQAAVCPASCAPRTATGWQTAGTEIINNNREAGLVLRLTHLKLRNLKYLSNLKYFWFSTLKHRKLVGYKLDLYLGDFIGSGQRRT